MSEVITKDKVSRLLTVDHIENIVEKTHSLIFSANPPKELKREVGLKLAEEEGFFYPLHSSDRSRITVSQMSTFLREAGTNWKEIERRALGRKATPKKPQPIKAENYVQTTMDVDSQEGKELSEKEETREVPWIDDKIPEAKALKACPPIKDWDNVKYKEKIKAVKRTLEDIRDILADNKIEESHQYNKIRTFFVAKEKKECVPPTAPQVPQTTVNDIPF